MVSGAPLAAITRVRRSRRMLHTRVTASKSGRQRIFAQQRAGERLWNYEVLQIRERAVHGIEPLVVARQHRGLEQLRQRRDAAMRCGGMSGSQAFNLRLQVRHGHEIARQRAGLVGAQHGRGAERFRWRRRAA